MSSRKKIGLALGSGASRGWAHIGVIEALKAAEVPIDVVTGCSVGAYVGAIYASNSLESLTKFLLEMDGENVFSYFDIVFPRAGLLNGTKRVHELFSMHTDKKTFEDLNIPLAMVATDLERGKKVILNSGNLIEALRATMSYPGLFAPVKRNGRWLVDGGLVDPVPVGLARAMGADIVIAVDLNSRIVSHSWQNLPDKEVQAEVEQGTASSGNGRFGNELVRKMAEYYENIERNLRMKTQEFLTWESSPPDIIETVMTSVSIMQERITRINLAVNQPDILLQPRLGGLKMMSFDQVEQSMEEGYISVREKMADIQNILA